MVGDKIGQPDVDETETRMCLYTRSKTRKRFLVSKRLGFSQRRFLIYFFFFTRIFHVEDDEEE